MEFLQFARWFLNLKSNRMRIFEKLNDRLQSAAEPVSSLLEPSWASDTQKKAVVA